MTDISKCKGVEVEGAGTVRKVCAKCYRLTAPTGDRQAWIEPEARRSAGNSWVCVNRIERVAA